MKNDLEITEHLKSYGLVGQVWPVYKWDESPRILAMVVPEKKAAKAIGVEVADIRRVIRNAEIHSYASEIVADKVKEYKALGINQSNPRKISKIRAPTSVKNCVVCGEEFKPKRASAKFCGEACKQKNKRNMASS